MSHAPAIRTIAIRLALAGLGLALAFIGTFPRGASAQETLRFAVGPFQPTPSDTRNAYEPFFKHLAEALGRDYELTVTNDWAGIAVALANGQADIAWMGPWGYVLANAEGGAQAIATVKYDGKPTYHAIIVGQPGLAIANWPQDAEGMSISFADVGSTSGWLIPTYWFQSQDIDPKTFFDYRDGASHAANEVAVANGQTDLATDYDRNRTAMIESGVIEAHATRIFWTSDPLPNDPLVVRADLDPGLVDRIREIVVGLSEEEADAIMPTHYTGWVPASHESYKLIEDAGLAVGKLKPR